MATDILKILMLEDVSEEAELIQRKLRHNTPPCAFKVVMTRNDFIRELNEFKPHIVLSDNEMPQFSGFEALEILKELAPDIPFILITGTVSEEFAVGIIKAGADDYLLKDRLARLPAAIEAALKIRLAEKEKQDFVVQLTQNEKLFRTLIESSNDIISLLDENIKFKYSSPSSIRLTGWLEEDLNKAEVIQFIHPDDTGDILNTFKESLANPDKPVKILTRYLHKSGHYLWIEGTLTNFLQDENINGLVFNFRDITERVEAETKLVSSEIRFRSLIENSAEGVSLLDEFSNVLYRSGAGYKVIGNSPVKNSIGYAHPDDREYFRNKFNESLNSPGIPVPYQVRFPHASGGYFWAEGTFTNLLHINEVDGVIANYRDISLRKEAELKLVKVNRLYLFISQVNQMIVRTKEESTLFKEVCEIAVEFGKFKMAWVGLIDKQTQKLDVVMQSGDIDNYLNKVNIKVAADKKEGRGPTGIAMREGKTNICNDIENDERMAPWKDTAMDCGFRASISIPIKKFDKVVGAFTLYAGEKNFFDSDETRLLEEAAGDLSFALEFIEKEELRKKAEAKVLESEQSYHTLTEISPVGIFRTDAAGLTTYVNPRWCQMSGMAAEAAFGYGWLKAVHEDDKKVMLATWDKALNTKDLSISEYRFIRPDGTIAWVYGQANPETNLNNEVVGYVGTITDITERKKAEVEIKTANERFDMISRATNDAVFEYDLVTGDSWHNDSFIALFNLPDSAEYIKPDTEKWREKIHPDDRDRVIHKLRAAYADQSISWADEFRFEKADGSYGMFYDRAKIVRDENGKAISLVGSMVEITELKDAQEKLLEQKVQLETLSNNLPGVMIYQLLRELNGTTKFTYISSGVTELTGKTQEDIMNNPGLMYELIHKEDLPKLIAGEKESFKNMTVFRMETRCVTHKGEIRWLSIVSTPRKLYDGRTVWDGFHLDITERKKAEEAILISNERYNLVSKATNDSIWDLDVLTDTITRTGGGFKTLFGYDEAAQVNSNRKFASLIHPEDIAATQESLKNVFNNPNEFYWEQEYRLLKADGNYAFVYDKGYIIRDQSGNALRMIGATQDITKLKENEIHLKKLNENLLEQANKLTESNDELERFAYVASHDMQEPLRMVTSFLILLEKKYRDTLDDSARKYIHFAVDGAKRMRQIILDLLDFSRVGQDYIEPQQLDLNRLISEIEILFSKQIEEKNATIEAEKLPVITASESPVRQVFQNLISNALKYSLDNKPVRIKITAISQGNCWQFSVEDNGIGISDEYFDKIFVIFQRLHNQDQFSGTGIGLAITKKIINKLGGKIWVESTEGKGTTFYFTIKK